MRDSETGALFKQISRPLIQAAGLDPNSVNVVLLNDPEINAFVATGQTVYHPDGADPAADNVNQVQGVVAHELGHVAGGHSIRMQDGVREATGITIATLVLGALAVAAGAGEAGMGMMMAGQQAAMGKFLAFTRTQEASADQAAVKYLHSAGISGKGMLEFFGKLQNQEYRLAIYAKDSYDRTHPLSSERIQALHTAFEADPPATGRSTRRSRRASSGSRPSCSASSIPSRRSFKYPESDQSVPGPLCARLCLSRRAAIRTKR